MMRKGRWGLALSAALVGGPSCGGETPDTVASDGGEGISAGDDSGDDSPFGDDSFVPVSDSAQASGGEGRDPDAMDDDCASVKVDVQRTTPTLVLLVDQSGSMTENFEGVQRWDAIYETLMEPETGVVAQLQSSVRFGLTLYSSRDGFEGGECPMLTTVAPAFQNLDAIDATFSRADPMDETPTGESLAAVAQQLAAFPEDGPKAIVLATDGEPDTCDVPNPQMGQPESVAAVEGAFDMGIRTFVISVGNEVGDGHLQELANVGMGRERNSSSPAPFYKALNSQELVHAFDEIVGGFLLCEFQIDGQVDPSRVCDGGVSIDGSSLACGSEWEVNGSSLRLMGRACEALGDGQQHVIDAEWPCGAIIPIP